LELKVKAGVKLNLKEGGASIDQYWTVHEASVVGQGKFCSACKICFRGRHCFFLPLAAADFK
jgi:hypothetical protein